MPSGNFFNLFSLLPLSVLFFVLNFIKFKISKDELKDVLFGLLYTLLGLTVFLTGIVYGSFLHKHGPRSSNLVAASIMVVAIRVGLDTLWLGILFDDSYLALMPVRLVKGLIDIPLQIVLIPLLWTVIAKTPIKTQIDKSAA